jgi:uracil-DNA glycosylase
VPAPLGAEYLTTLHDMPGDIPRFDILGSLPGAWSTAMRPFLDPDTVAGLERFLAAEYAEHEVCPPRADLFAAFRHCAPTDVRVVLLGQDPYHRVGQAHGLSFSVPAGVPVPPSLRNVFKELRDDLGDGLTEPRDELGEGAGGDRAPASPPVRAKDGRGEGGQGDPAGRVGTVPAGVGDLTRWAEQGVLLLNAVLTVRAGAPGSHAGHGWEHLTDAAIRVVDAQPARVVFLLWGAYARRKSALVTGAQHVVLTAGHPSPLNPRGFLGSRPFSACNAALVESGRPAVRW